MRPSIRQPPSTLPRGRAERRAARGRGVARLGERLSEDRALLEDAAVDGPPVALVAVAVGRRHLQVVRHLARPQHRGGVHVEGERGGAAPAAELGRDQAVAREVRAEPAVALGNRQREKAGRAQVVVVLERKARSLVVLGGARREAVAAETARDRDELALAFAEREVHGCARPQLGRPARNSCSAASNAAGRSRLARWPAPGSTRYAAPRYGLRHALDDGRRCDAVALAGERESRAADRAEAVAAVERHQAVERRAVGVRLDGRHALDGLRDALGSGSSPDDAGDQRRREVRRRLALVERRAGARQELRAASRCPRRRTRASSRRAPAPRRDRESSPPAPARPSRPSSVRPRPRARTPSRVEEREQRLREPGERHAFERRARAVARHVPGDARGRRRRSARAGRRTLGDRRRCRAGTRAARLPRPRSAQAGTGVTRALPGACRL